MASIFRPYTIFDVTCKVLKLTKIHFENPKINKNRVNLYKRDNHVIENKTIDNQVIERITNA